MPSVPSLTHLFRKHGFTSVIQLKTRSRIHTYIKKGLFIYSCIYLVLYVIFFARLVASISFSIASVNTELKGTILKVNNLLGKQIQKTGNQACQIFLY